MNNQETQQQTVFGVDSFFRKEADLLKKRFTGKTDIIISSVCIAAMLLLSMLFRSVAGCIFAVILVLTVFSIIVSAKNKSFAPDLKASLGSFLGGLKGSDISKTGRLVLIAVSTILPFLIALIDIPYLAETALCLFFSARRTDALPVVFADAVCGSIKKSNPERTHIRRYFMGFSIGLFIFGTVFGIIRAVNNVSYTSVPSNDISLSVSAQPGTFGDFEASVVTAFNKESSYNVILESSTLNTDDSRTVRYGLYRSDEVTPENYSDSTPVSKIVLVCSGTEKDDVILSFTCGLPYYSTLSISSGSADCAELERWAKYILKGILPGLSDGKIKDIYKKMYIPDKNTYSDIAEKHYVASAWWYDNRTSIVRFGTDDECFVSVYFVSKGSMSSSDGYFYLRFEDIAAETDVK